MEENKEYIISGEIFQIVEDDKEIFLLHPRWSLIGRGRNIAAAVLNLYSEAELISDAYTQESEEMLSEEARNLTEFLNKIKRK